MKLWTLSGTTLSALIFLQVAFGREGIEVTTWLDKTAFYVGEPIHYQVTVQYPNSVEFILERLQERNLRMDPFEIRRLSHSFKRGNGYHTLTLELELVTYEISRKQWQIPAFDLYLIRKDALRDKPGESQVEALQIPEQHIAFRSTLPDESMQVRDYNGTQSFVGKFWVSALTALLLLVLLVIPLGARLFGSRDPVKESIRPERSQMKRVLADKLQACKWDAREDEAVLLLYKDLALILRKFAGWVAGKRGGALSGKELQSVLSGREKDSEVEWISELVQLADRVRYSPSGLAEGRFRLNDVRQKTLEIFRQS